MQKHQKRVFDFYEFSYDEYVPCFMCGKPAVDVHHIDPKGMGGRESVERLDNYIPLCRSCHNDAHKGKITKEQLWKRVQTVITLKEEYPEVFFQFKEGNKFTFAHLKHMERNETQKL